MPSKVPTELQEQIAIAKVLRRSGICFTHVPNGGRRDRREGASLKLSGVQAGVPDILIFDAPPNSPSAAGVALEMKRENGRMSSLSAAQRKWLDLLAARGWVCIVGFGAMDAREKLRELGYEVK